MNQNSDYIYALPFIAGLHSYDPNMTLQFLDATFNSTNR